MRVGIFGGSFNPVHEQHLRIADAAKVQLKLDEIWFLPVFKPVHKNQKLLLSYESRRSMLSAAISDFSSFRICDAEQELGGNSYTIRTLRYLLKKFPQKEFHLIIGGDSLADFSSWREADLLAKLVPIAVIRRPGNSEDSSIPGAILNWVDVPLSSASSSDIREKLSMKSFKDLPLPDNVLFEILWGNFYDSLKLQEGQALEKIKRQYDFIPEGLCEHMKSVARQCIMLCRKNSISPVIGFFLGLGHDLFRASKDEKLIENAKKSGFELTSLEFEIPMLSHGAAAAGFFKDLNIFEADFLKALRFHTFPENDNGVLTMLLAVADTLDPSRGIPARISLLNSQKSLKELFVEVLLLKKYVNN